VTVDVDSLVEIQRRSYERAATGVTSSWPEAAALDAEGMASLVGELRYCVLATARSDGRPHAAPVAYTVVRGAFWIATVEGVRLRNLRASPWASLVVMDGEGERHRALTVEGPVRLHEGDALAAVRDGLDAQWAERHGRAPSWAAAFVEVHPRRVFSYRARGFAGA
jgi:nitroimidazol reductase NimA-like FMN-containing flavoprotein (pyridoxamine 5'-phosphate oxidase superfamily)